MTARAAPRSFPFPHLTQGEIQELAALEAIAKKRGLSHPDRTRLLSLRSRKQPNPEPREIVA